MLKYVGFICVSVSCMFILEYAFDMPVTETFLDVVNDATSAFNKLGSGLNQEDLKIQDHVK